jgi:excinuclease UvrABC nuclease subunit
MFSKDVSHTQGDYTCASRVVFINGKPAKSLYRLFNIKTVEGVDDFASLEEVFDRRFRRALGVSTTEVDKKDEWVIPDLVRLWCSPRFKQIYSLTLSILFQGGSRWGPWTAVGGN